MLRASTAVDSAAVLVNEKFSGIKQVGSKNIWQRLLVFYLTATREM